MQSETQLHIVAMQSGVKPGTVAYQSFILGAENGEPLVYGLHGLLRYADAYKLRNESTLSDDGVLGPCFLDALKGLRGLLNGDGAVAMERGITTDSKDNGMCEGIFWAALEAGGYTEADL